MKFVSLSCPNCGATLLIEEDSKKVTCMYCEKVFFIDDEIQRVEHKIVNAKQSGYDFEQGRIQARNEQALEHKKELFLQQQLAQRIKEQKEIDYKNEVDRAESAENKKVALLICIGGTIISFYIPYLIPFILTVVVCILPRAPLKAKIISILAIWIISMTIMGIHFLPVKH